MNAMAQEKENFKKRVRHWSAKLDAPVLSISVRRMKNKWASYSTNGRLTFDASLMGMHRELQDYVIVHELLHFYVPNHGKLWKSLMRAYLGDYERFEEELKRKVHKEGLQPTC